MEMENKNKNRELKKWEIVTMLWFYEKKKRKKKIKKEPKVFGGD